MHRRFITNEEINLIYHLYSVSHPESCLHQYGLTGVFHTLDECDASMVYNVYNIYYNLITPLVKYHRLGKNMLQDIKSQNGKCCV